MITAIIVNHNSGEQIIEAIRHIEAQETAVESIIVVDSGSTDGSSAEARAASTKVEVIELKENLGPSIARNHGLRAAKTEFVLIVDDDVYLACDCVARLMPHFSDGQVTAVVPRIILYPENSLIQLDGADTHLVGAMVLHNSRVDAASTPAQVTDIGAFSTSCVLGRRQALLDAGGLDENYFIYLEDQEFGLRLRVFGHRLICNAGAIAWHDRGDGTPDLSFRDTGEYPKRRAYLTMRNRWQTILIHYQLRNLLLLSPVLLFYELASVAKAAKRGWIGLWFQSWMWLWRNRASLRKRRQFVEHRRQINEASLLICGELPLAPGLISGSLEGKAVALLTFVINGYGRLVRPALKKS